MTRVLTVLWLLLTGLMGLALQVGDGELSASPPAHWAKVLGFYLIVGFVLGLINPHQWKLAGLAIWAVALFGILMRPAPDGAVAEWVGWLAEYNLRLVLVPMAAALAGGLVAYRLRGRHRQAPVSPAGVALE